MKLESLTEAVEPRMIYLIMVASCCLFALFSYLYLFKSPLKQYRQLHQNRTMLEAKVENSSQLSSEIASLESEIEGLNRKLQGENPPLMDREMVAHTIARLDAISATRTVSLRGVKPEVSQQVGMFKEIPFDIEVVGDYVYLYEWLRDVERQFGSMVIKQFELRPVSGSDDLQMRMKLVSYQPMDEK